MPTQLEIIADRERNILMSRNEYNLGDLYSSNNTGALSDGDERGKGELSGNIGSKTDIVERTSLVAKNPYGPTNEYNSGNPNALSDGDERGKGELNNSIGSKTDITERNTLLSKNV